MAKKRAPAVLPVVLLLFAAADASADGHYKFADGTKNFYLGHISYVEAQGDGEDPVVLREGLEKPEPATLNLPVGPGDTVRTSASRRCEIQFDSGTIIRLDVGTELRVETILAKSLSSPLRISSLLLKKGRLYLMYKEYGVEEMFQVLTPNAALKLKHQTVAIVRAAADLSTDVQVKYGRVSVLLGADEKTSRRQDVGRGERLIVLSDSQVQLASYIADTDFDRWNDEINRNFLALHDGKSALPRPLNNLPDAVFYFAQNFSSRYGEWLWDDICGYVWRPFLNDGQYPWGGWQPYYYGRWADVQGRMYWVPDEPWGWIPYHLGIWQWDAKKGWFWIPGSFFAPAWADWEFYFGYYGWRPLSLWDFTGQGFGLLGTGYGYDYGEGWIYYNPPDSPPDKHPPAPPLTVVRRDQLKQPNSPVVKLPKEIKGAVERLVAAYNRGDVSVRQNLRGVAASLRFVPREDIGARRIQDKAVMLEKLPRSSGPPADKDSQPVVGIPRAEAFRAWRSVDMRQGANPRPEALRTMGSAAFRDWNPDVAVAHTLGVRIQYSSAKNEIRCPELKISSRDRDGGRFGGPIMTPSGAWGGGDGNFSGSGSGGAYSGPPSAAAGASHAGASGSHTSGGDGKTKH